MPQIAGGCLCGKVRYSASGDPVFVGVCHCTDCQKFTGSAFAVVVGLPKSALTIQGPLSTFDKTGDTAQNVSARKAASARLKPAGECTPAVQTGV